MLFWYSVSDLVGLGGHKGVVSQTSLLLLPLLVHGPQFEQSGCRKHSLGTLVEQPFKIFRKWWKQQQKDTNILTVH